MLSVGNRQLVVSFLSFQLYRLPLTLNCPLTISAGAYSSWQCLAPE